MAGDTNYVLHPKLFGGCDLKRVALDDSAFEPFDCQVLTTISTVFWCLFQTFCGGRHPGAALVGFRGPFMFSTLG